MPTSFTFNFPIDLPTPPEKQDDGIVLSLVRHDDPILTQVAEPADVRDPDIIAIVSEMARLMHDEDGVAIAAPQCGVAKRIIYVEKLGALINPVIIAERGGWKMGWESCVSRPNERFRVRRAKEIDVEAIVCLPCEDDPDSVQWKRATMKGLNPELSRIVAHEIDHLNGKTIWAK